MPRRGHAVAEGGCGAVGVDSRRQQVLPLACLRHPTAGAQELHRDRAAGGRHGVNTSAIPPAPSRDTNRVAVNPRRVGHAKRPPLDAALRACPPEATGMRSPAPGRRFNADRTINTTPFRAGASQAWLACVGGRC
jgi:hypothetical protein